MNRRWFFSGSFAVAVSAILPGLPRTEPMILAAARIPGDLAYDALISGTPMITVIVEGNLIGDQRIKQLLADSVGELIDADEILITPKFRPLR